MIITVDAKEDFLGLSKMTRDLGARARAFKLGQRLLMHEQPWALVTMLKVRGVEVHLDAKYEEDADQMGPTVTDAFDKGFKHVSVAPASGAAALVAAAKAVPPDRGLFAALPSGNDRITGLLMEEVVEANSHLDADRQIHEVMCNVSDIGMVKRMGNFTIIATGIRLPGDTPDDHPSVATPAEALAMGADYLAVGRAITARPERTEAFEQILENIATYR